MRQQGILEEWGIQQHLADAVEQDQQYKSSQQQQQDQHRPGVELVSSDQALQLCYSRVKDVLSQHWPQEQKHMAGLLLLQRERPSGQPQSIEQKIAGGAADVIDMAVDGQGLFELGIDPLENSSKSDGQGGVFSRVIPSTVLRVQSITAGGAMLQLPRGKHVLRIMTPDWGLHAVSLAAAVPFTVGDALKVMAAAERTSVICQEGEHEALQPGTVQYLFR